VAPGREASTETVVAPVPLSGVGEAWSADHRPLGIFVGAGPRIRPGRGGELSLYTVCPTALALLERPVPSGLDGRVATDALDASWLESHPVRIVDRAVSRTAEGEYSDEEAAAIEASLKGIGYL
jgi:hypothetical protein